MCGLFGLFMNRPLQPEDIEIGRKGISMLHHRGPDGTGEWCDVESGVFLAHKRLAILDLSEASAQPFRHKNLTISYNGEIFNFQELRRSLESENRPFRTTGDVEVLLNAWDSQGPGSLYKLDGMFAFALWDSNTGYLGTDAFG